MPTTFGANDVENQDDKRTTNHTCVQCTQRSYAAQVRADDGNMNK